MSRRHFIFARSRQHSLAVPCQSEPSGLSREQFTKECNWIKLEEGAKEQTTFHFSQEQTKFHFIQEQTTFTLSQEQTKQGADNISFKPGADNFT
jgi:hypothetical protein